MKSANTATKVRALVGLIKKSELETELARYEALNLQIKELTAQKDRLKNSLVKSYFEKNPTYKNKDGSLVATYLPQDRTCLSNQELKEAFPKIYEEFSYQQTVYMFVVKTIN
jgi:DNA integrity scanning protein DisA with diadenylate cyclase activity